MCPRINLVDPASNQIIFIIVWRTSGCLPEITVNKGIVVMKSKRESRPNGKLRLRIFVPVERVLGVSEFLLSLKDTLIGIYKRVSSECSICVTITFVITALRPKKGFKWG